MRGSQDAGAKGAGSVVTAGPWTARDSYIAETAVTLDRLSAKIERLERREEALKAQVAELQEHAQQLTRFQALAESLRNSRDYKLEEISRLVKDLRARLEVVEGPRAEFAGLTFKNLVAVERKLMELATVQSRHADLAGRLQPGSLAIGFLAAIVVTSFTGLIS
ncbi:MAG: hypothetical protein AB7S70_06970 [Hyphomicrobium sp.]|uniref:hypothetical protein n=1 Tax=Hyphomicrobium sp. TaxID=82 RepID=UPI003D0FE700